MKRTALSVALLLCLVVFAATAGGCQLVAQKATEGALETATGGAVKVNGDSVTIKGENGEATVSNETKIPADFPASVPLRDDGSVQAVITTKVDGGTAYMANIKFKVPQAELLTWYKSEFEKAGWKIVSTVTTGEGGMITAEKDGLSVSIVTGAESSEGFTSAITMQVSPKAK